jgi:hypothetical protein
MRARSREAASPTLDWRRRVAQALEPLAPAESVRGIRVPRLPLPLIDRQLRAPAVVVGGFLLVALFLLPARFHLGEPAVLDKSVVDDWIPFLEWTIWIYASYYLFLILAIWLPRDDKLRSDAAYGLVLAGLIGLVIFRLLPTSVVRPSPSSTGATGLLWRLLFSVDTMVNALPSLHVANYLSCGIRPRVAESFMAGHRPVLGRHDRSVDGDDQAALCDRRTRRPAARRGLLRPRAVRSRIQNGRSIFGPLLAGHAPGTGSSGPCHLA